MGARHNSSLPHLCGRRGCPAPAVHSSFALSRTWKWTRIRRVKIPGQLFLDGAWRNSSSGRPITLINPSTEESFAEVAAADITDMNAAVESAQRAWESGWRDL